MTNATALDACTGECIYTPQDLNNHGSPNTQPSFIQDPPEHELHNLPLSELILNNLTRIHYSSTKLC
jgi:hypothetical protein